MKPEIFEAEETETISWRDGDSIVPEKKEVEVEVCNQGLESSKTRIKSHSAKMGMTLDTFWLLWVAAFSLLVGADMVFEWE